MTQDQPPLRRELIPYVRARMEQRGVPVEAVDFVLQNYHTARPAGPRRGSRPAIVYIGTWNGRNLRVYVERDSDPPFVKTVAWED